jgi:hypothetical protein
VDFHFLVYEMNIVLPVVYGCETWSLTLKEERRLRVFENRVLRRLFGPKRDEVTGEWKKIHNKERNDLYFLTFICLSWTYFRMTLGSRSSLLASHIVP